MRENQDRTIDETDAEDLQDRLLDRALAEVVGREVPPDLAPRILAADAKLTAATPAQASFGKSSRVRRMTLLAVAASLIIAIPMMLTPQENRYKEHMGSRSSTVAKMNRVLTRPISSEEEIDISVVVNDAQGPWQSSKIDAGGRSKEGNRSSVPVAAESEALSASAGADPASGGFQGAATATPPSVAPPVEKNISFGYRWNASSPNADAQLKHLVTLSDGSGTAIPQLADSVSANQSFAEAYQRQAQQGLMKYRRSRNVLIDQSGVDLEAIHPASDLRRLQYGVLGTGPGSPGDQYTRIYENPFVRAVGGEAVSTFSIDVDTASYANVRQFLRDERQLPPPDAVRIEELLNYFDYDYAPPAAGDEAPFAAHVEVAGCPWAAEHRLVRIAVKGREIERDKRPPSNLVFLVDVSGSMDEPNKLPLVVDGLRQLTRELGENDRVAIVVYASSEGLALPSTRGDQQQTILATLDRLRAGGSTAGGAGIQLAYQIAEDHFIPGGTNRVVLCTDGDFNVGVTSTAELERLVAQKAKDTKVFLSVLGFGRGNLNDAMMQTIADRGNGNHHYVDSLREARKVLVEELTGTLITIAKDVKLRVEFNPAHVAAYRLVGYENRLLRTEDFNDDTKDAGEIGAGHTVTALYEIVPAGVPTIVPAVDELKYQVAESEKAGTADKPASDELLTLKMRYKEPEDDTSRKLEWPVVDSQTGFPEASRELQFAAAVAEFGLLLRGSEFKGTANFDQAAEIAAANLGADPHGYRAEFVELVRRAHELSANR